MSKIGLILEREYISRVKKKSFLVMSLLAPLLFTAMLVLPAWLTTVDEIPEQRIAVIDYTNKYIGFISDTDVLRFVYLEKDQEQAFRDNLSSTGYDAYIIIENDLIRDNGAVSIYSEAQVTVDVKNHIAYYLSQAVRNEKVRLFDMDGFKEKMELVNATHVNIKTIKLSSSGVAQESSTEIIMIFAVIFSLMVYMFIFMYGAQVMRGVMEEKSSRIIEVIISSVKPFQLMMGKILGVALVALTQFLIWIVLTISILFFVKLVVFPTEAMPTRMDDQVEMISQLSSQDDGAVTQFNDVLAKVKSINILQILICFVLYFIGGYLVYAALFAAIGSAIDVESDTQQFMLPLTIPLILSMYVAMTAFQNPGGDLAFWFSMIPLTSPVVMMARIPFDIPIWELVLSLSVLYGFFVLATWFAARVYRTGILIYGKKVNLKELWKWFLYSNR